MRTQLPMPELRECEVSGISFLTDEALAEACGTRIAFTGRAGGVSTGSYASLNLGDHVGDDPAAVEANRRAVLHALGDEDAALITLNQVHGDRVLAVREGVAGELAETSAQAAEGADGVVIGVPDVAAILCFADCVPVIIASRSGAFAVAHAGWRGVMAGTAVRAMRNLAALDAQRGDAPDETQAITGYNIYLGPHIGACCFQTGADVRVAFRDRFGDAVLAGDDRVDLARALRLDFERAGATPARICDSGICTMCASDRYYSYRASGGTCGRHAAAAVGKR